MSIRRLLNRLTQQEDLNFLLTNRIPRLQLTRFMGWFSRIEQPLVRQVSMALWRFFGDLDLTDARQSHFKSLHDCFVRELRPGARPMDTRPEWIVSPCDAIVGESGQLLAGQLFQAKGFAYRADELFGRHDISRLHEGGCYVTLRLTSGMYHRFHAPADCRLEHVTYFSGDTWNVNPIALRRIERLFCKNERVMLRLMTQTNSDPITLVAVAAILVASVRLHALDYPLNLSYRGPNEIPVVEHYGKGAEIGWFEHGSTILVFSPPGFELHDRLMPGHRIRAGEALMRRLDASQRTSTDSPARTRSPGFTQT